MIFSRLRLSWSQTLAYCYSPVRDDITRGHLTAGTFSKTFFTLQLWPQINQVIILQENLSVIAALSVDPTFPLASSLEFSLQWIFSTSDSVPWPRTLLAVQLWEIKYFSKVKKGPKLGNIVCLLLPFFGQTSSSVQSNTPVMNLIRIWETAYLSIFLILSDWWLMVR